MLPSSIVTTTSWVASSLRISSLSSGLAKRKSATVVERPLASSWSAALSASASRVPSERSATLLPSRTIRPLPIASRSGVSGSAHAGAVAARIAEGDRAVVVQRGGVGHVDQLGLVGRGHDHEVGQRGEIGHVEAAGMGRAVGADQARRGRSRSAPAGSGSPRRGRPGRRRAGGRSNRSRRTGACPARRGRRRKSPRAARRCRRRRRGRGMRLANLSSPVPLGIAAVIAQIVGSRSASAISASPNTFWYSSAGRRRLGLLAGDRRRTSARRGTCRRCPRPGRSPCPSWSRHGPGIGPSAASRTFSSTGISWSRLCPSIGPT